MTRKKLTILKKRLKRTKKLQYYYHVTELSWGENKTLKPRNKGRKRDPNESDIPRICVGPSVAHCLASTVVEGVDMDVYRTKNKIFAYIPFDVFDMKHTRERWLLKSIKFIYIGTISSSITNEIERKQLDGTNDCDSNLKVGRIKDILKKYIFPTHP